MLTHLHPTPGQLCAAASTLYHIQHRRGVDRSQDSNAKRLTHQLRFYLVAVVGYTRGDSSDAGIFYKAGYKDTELSNLHIHVGRTAALGGALSRPTSGITPNCSCHYPNPHCSIAWADCCVLFSASIMAHKQVAAVRTYNMSVLFDLLVTGS